MAAPDQLRSLQSDAYGEIDAIIHDWGAGTYDWDTASGLLESLLKDGHADAHRLGVDHGDGTSHPDEDKAAADMVWHGTEATRAAGVTPEADYYAALHRDVVNGRYGTPGSEDDPPRGSALYQRARMYAGKWTGSANDAWIHTNDSEVMYQWVLDDGASHCSDCPDYAAGGPYATDELPGVPGDGGSACLDRCRCELVTVEDSKAGFRTEDAPAYSAGESGD